jgi:acyl carrier protein
MSDLENRLRKVIADGLNLDEADIPPDKNFEDLGADSLDGVELVMALEEEFNLDIPDDDAERLNTLAEVLTYLNKRLPAQSTPS